MSGFKPYPAYKDSGVEWLGEVPEHWVVHSLKRAIERIESGTSVNAADYPAEPGSYGVLKTSCVYTGQFDWTENKTVNDEDLSRVSCPVQKNTLIVSRMNTPDLVGATGLVTQAPDGIFLPDRLWQVYFTDNHSPGFLFYFTKSREYREQVKMVCSGTSASMQNLGQDDFRNLQFVEPSKSEQTQIAQFLDHETARLDALIAELQKLIELLKEKRRCMVLSSHSDQTIPLTRIEHAVDVIYRPVKQREGELYTPIGLFNRDRGLFHKEPREMRDMGESDFFWIKSGDLIISGQFAWEGAVAMASDEEEGMVVSHRYPVLRGKRGLMSTEYLYSLLTTKHGDFLLNESSRGAAGRNRPLNLREFLKEKIRIPSEEVQNQICALVHKEAKVLTECRQQISLLQERRSALISAAVTGKIDVRNWQAGEP